MATHDHVLEVLPLVTMRPEESDGMFGEDVEELERPVPHKTRSTSFLITLALGLGGLQVVFAVIFSHGAIHLRSVGLSKSLISIALAAGPLSGTVLQPLVGIWSDHCRFSWGRRMPFIIFGSAATIFSLLGLAWVEFLVQFVEGKVQGDPNSSAIHAVSIMLMFSLNFAIQPVQGGIRALIVDNSPTHQLQDANAMAGRVISVANVMSYLSAFLKLQDYLSFFGDTQFKNLSALASLSLAITVAISYRFVNETTSEAENPTVFYGKNLLEEFRHSCIEIERIPTYVKKIYQIQFFAWIGWFPYLFFVTTYLGEIYITNISARNSSALANKQDEAREDASRIGSLALLGFAIVSLAASLILPTFVQPLSAERFPEIGRISLGQNLDHTKATRSTLGRLWVISHALFALCMFGTFFISSLWGTILLFSIVGVSWAITSWVPYTLLSIEISRSHLPDPLGESHTLHAGTIMGLHNAALSFPQLLATLGTSIFWNIQESGYGHSDNSNVWILRSGGIAAVVAMYLGRRL